MPIKSTAISSPNMQSLGGAAIIKAAAAFPNLVRIVVTCSNSYVIIKSIAMGSILLLHYQVY
ncbi:MAG TPA: hypothetical protein VE619_04295 [Nitrososphaeraceae archaeon]|nr:hypothetical protein [Nitrososphaeraceae archaeon]